MRSNHIPMPSPKSAICGIDVLGFSIYETCQFLYLAVYKVFVISGA